MDGVIQLEEGGWDQKGGGKTLSTVPFPASPLLWFLHKNCCKDTDLINNCYRNSTDAFTGWMVAPKIPTVRQYFRGVGGLDGVSPSGE